MTVTVRWGGGDGDTCVEGSCVGGGGVGVGGIGGGGGGGNDGEGGRGVGGGGGGDGGVCGRNGGQIAGDDGAVSAIVAKSGSVMVSWVRAVHTGRLTVALGTVGAGISSGGGDGGGGAGGSGQSSRIATGEALSIARWLSTSQSPLVTTPSADGSGSELL